MKEIKLTSGNILKIQPASFSDARNLYQSILEEIKNVRFEGMNSVNVVKDLLCSAFSSKKIEFFLEKCMKSCVYNNGKIELKIDESTFEDVDSRKDYIDICHEVVKENIEPFMPSLYALLNHYREKITKDSQA